MDLRPDLSGPEHHFLRRIGASGQETQDIAEWTGSGWATRDGLLGRDGKPLASGGPRPWRGWRVPAAAAALGALGLGLWLGLSRGS